VSLCVCVCVCVSVCVCVCVCVPFPGSQVFISLFVNGGFITQSSPGAGCIKVTLIIRPMGSKGGREGAHMM